MTSRVSYARENVSNASFDTASTAQPDYSPPPSRSSHSSIAGAPVAAPELTPSLKVTGPALVTPSAEGSKTTSTAVKAPVKNVLNAKNGIPINRFGQRIDLKLRAPSREDLEKFEKRIASRKLCNEHHLRDACYAYGCRYDHGAVDAAILNTLRHKARTIACSQGEKCRKLDCFCGHQCPWGDCGNPKCAFEKAGLHDIRDLEVARYVPAV